MHRSTLFLVACVGVLGGIALASWFIVGSLVLWVLAFVGALTLLTHRTRMIIVGVFCIAAALGAWRAMTVLSRPSALWDIAATKPTVTLAGFVDGDFEPTASGGRFTFHVVRMQAGDSWERIDDRLLASGPDWIKPRQGQILILTGKIQRPNSYDDFDYASYLAKDDIHAVMYYPKYSVPEERILPWYAQWRILAFGQLARLRLAMTDSIARVVPQPESGYLTGILVGAKGVVSADMKDIFARTGTSHILAISGYNITIVASLLMSALAPLGRRRSYWFAIVGIVLFTIMVGAGASVVRAAIMGILAITAQRLGRFSGAGMAMAVSAAAMCWYNPTLLRWDVGFQLSFLAFAGIVYVEPLIRPFFKRLLRWKYLSSLVATTFAAQVLVLPILLYDFNQFAVYTLPTNMLMLPFVPVAMAFGFATAIVGLVWHFAGALVGQAAWLIAAYQISVARFFASLPYAAFEVHISWMLVVALYAGLAAWLVAVYRVGVLQNHTHAKNPRFQDKDCERHKNICPGRS